MDKGYKVSGLSKLQQVTDTKERATNVMDVLVEGEKPSHEFEKAGFHVRLIGTLNSELKKGYLVKHGDSAKNKEDYKKHKRLRIKNLKTSFFRHYGNSANKDFRIRLSNDDNSVMEKIMDILEITKGNIQIRHDTGKDSLEIWPEFDASPKIWPSLSSAKNEDDYDTSPNGKPKMRRASKTGSGRSLPTTSTNTKVPTERARYIKLRAIEYPVDPDATKNVLIEVAKQLDTIAQNDHKETLAQVLTRKKGADQSLDKITFVSESLEDLDPLAGSHETIETKPPFHINTHGNAATHMSKAHKLMKLMDLRESDLVVTNKDREELEINKDKDIGAIGSFCLKNKERITK